MPVAICIDDNGHIWALDSNGNRVPSAQIKRVHFPEDGTQPWGDVKWRGQYFGRLLVHSC
ncbi:hypothetical protein [Agrobacterium tumefaciens]|nr:hypothetical protein [Agrobacterium tumefaciens]NTD91400.1 hypothetical protein [Agrobacterium tumefaciens]NTD98848.1 hypothetical protein [Agrobacterium tumefaciens]NTE12228.1 hypothetical protein [Agrobacterium tumefaciens]NTE20306.1 hypothetical protein [Agrobacterium tumefaciens]